MISKTLKYRHGRHVEKILARDKFQCVFCSSKGDLVIDHILPVRQGGKSTLKNQRTLCRSCHSSLTNTKDEKDLSVSGKYQRQWRLKHPNYMTEYQRAWRKRNPKYDKRINARSVDYQLYRQSLI